MKRNLVPCVLAVTVAAALTLAVGCATTADGNDPTPPSVELRYRLDGEEWTLLTGDDRVELTGDVLHLWAIAKDPGGVKSVTIRGKGTIVCRKSSGLRYNDDVDVSNTHAEDPTVEAGDRTESSRSVTYDFYPDEQCTMGADSETDEYKSGEVAFSASALNFSGLSASSPTLTAFRE